MKKKLEGELISIAHRVLKLKNRSETIQLQQETKNLFEKLTVLRFYEENFETFKSEISLEQLEEKLAQTSVEEVVETPIEATKETQSVVEEQVQISAETIAPTEIIEEEIEATAIVEEVVELPKKEIEATAEDINRIVAEMTANKQEKTTNPTQQISFENLLGDSYKEPEFIRVEEVQKTPEKAAEVVETKKEEFSFKPKEVEKQEPKTVSLNDRLNTGIAFGLNDRIAFEKKLFGGSQDDFNRVISQLNTFDSFDEAKAFITDFVKPDYKNWEGQEEFEIRFLEIVEKKFN